MASIITVFVCATICTAAPLRVIDGDTVVLRSETIRLLDIDAPETFRHHCPNELKRGLEAKASLQRLLTGARITIDRHGTDRYRRTLAHIAIGDDDLGAAMLRSGHAIPWRPGRQAYRERTKMWCG